MQEIFEEIKEIKQKLEGIYKKAQNYQASEWEKLFAVTEYIELVESILNLDSIFKNWLNLTEINPPQKLREKYQVLTGQIQSREKSLHELKQELKKLSEKEKEWQKISEEYERLQKELNRLKNIQSLVENLNLDELKEQVEQLKKVKNLIEADKLIQQISNNAGEILVLSNETISKLEPEVQKMLQQVEEVINKIKEKKQELSDLNEKYMKAKTEFENISREIKSLIEADEKIAKALPSNETGNILNAIEQVKSMIQTIEKSLEIAISKNQERYPKQKIFLGG